MTFKILLFNSEQTVLDKKTDGKFSVGDVLKTTNKGSIWHEYRFIVLGFLNKDDNSGNSNMLCSDIQDRSRTCRASVITYNTSKKVCEDNELAKFMINELIEAYEKKILSKV